MATGSGVMTMTHMSHTAIAAKNGAPIPAAVSSTMSSNTSRALRTKADSASARTSPPAYGALTTYSPLYSGLSTMALPVSHRPDRMSPMSYTVLPETPAM